jgi:aspartate racemase
LKRIGLLGGISWESTAEYYSFVNEAVRDRLGGLHSADCLVRSVDFARIERLQRDGRWAEAGALLAEEARALVAAGAEVLALCTNTMHKVADESKRRRRCRSCTLPMPPPRRSPRVA